MIKVNINKQIGCKTFLFPDKQPHINIDGVNENDEVQVTCSITDANNLLLLLLASVQKVVKLEPIEGADLIEKATVLGWEIVVKKGEYKVGDLFFIL